MQRSVGRSAGRLAAEGSRGFKAEKAKSHRYCSSLRRETRDLAIINGRRHDIQAEGEG